MPLILFQDIPASTADGIDHARFLLSQGRLPEGNRVAARR
jgi:hypothetical protein